MISSIISKKSLVQSSAANQPLNPLPLDAVVAPARVPSPRKPEMMGFSNISKNAVDFRQITFFQQNEPLSRELQKQQTDAVVIQLKQRFVQTPRPIIILGSPYMNARGAQLAQYLKQMGLTVCIDGFAKLTQFYQRNHANIQGLAASLATTITDDMPLVYFGETHMVHKMVAPPHHFIQRMEQAWQKGSLTIIAEQHAVFSGKQQTFTSSAQQVVDQLLEGCEAASSLDVQDLTPDQTKQLFESVTFCIRQSRNWPDAMAAIFVLLNNTTTLS
jgi:hypothetical protein